MQEQPHQSDTQALDGTLEREQQHYKTLAVRLDEGMHAQLRFIAQLSGSSITDEIRRSINDRISAAQNDSELMARAEELRQEIEREASARTAAIAGFLGKAAVETPPVSATTRSRTARRAKSGE